MNARQTHDAERTALAPVSMEDLEFAFTAPHNAQPHTIDRWTGDVSGCLFGLTNVQLLSAAARRPRPTKLELHLADRLTEALHELGLMARERLALLGTP